MNQKITKYLFAFITKKAVTDNALNTGFMKPKFALLTRNLKHKDLKVKIFKVNPFIKSRS